MLGPYIGLAMDPSRINDINILVSIHETYGFGFSPINFLGILLIIIFGLRTFFAILINQRILAFCRDVQISLRTSMMSSYQGMSYERFISRDSSDAITNITILTMYYTNNVLYYCLKAIAELLLALFIFSFLISINISLVLILSFGLAFLVLAYNNFFKTRMNSYGKKMNEANSNAVQSVKQSLEGVKEVRILGKENFFLNRLKKNAREYASLHANSLLITTGSKYFIEFAVLIFFVMSISASGFFVSNESEDIFGTLGMFAFAAIRLLPGVNIISAAVLQLRSQKNTVDRLYETVDELNLDLDAKEKFNQKTNINDKKTKQLNSIKLKDVSYAYPSSKKNILEKVSIEIFKGESIGVIGPSGAGKTTLIDILLGLLSPSSGKILFNGENLSHVIEDWRNITAYIPQDSLMINETLSLNINLSEDLDLSNQKNLLSKSIFQAQLSEVVKNLPEGLQTNIGEGGIRLSGGQRQRVSLARAIFHSRDVLVFDEATSALDTETEKEVIREIKKMKGIKTMIIITHRNESLKFCDRIYKIENGQITGEGSPEEML